MIISPKDHMIAPKLKRIQKHLAIQKLIFNINYVFFLEE